MGIIHERTFKWNDNKIEIKDYLNKHSKAKAFFHFHSSIKRPKIKNNKLLFTDLGVTISFLNHSNFNIQTYELSHGFNLIKTSFKIVVCFDQTLITQIQL